MLLPIGRFARVSRLSVKSLRNYDDSGLLPAAFVDPQSSYRYYGLDQLARADAIRSLRMVDMPLSQIAIALDGDDPETTLMSHLAELELQRDDLTRKVQQLQRRIETKEYSMSTQVSFKTNPEIIAVAHHTATTADGIFHDIPAGFTTVMQLLTESQTEPAGVPFTAYYQAPDADAPGAIAMCIPVASTDGLDQANVITFPAGVTASVMHEGSYDDMGRSYAAIATWVHERGHQIIGPTREVYLNSPAEVAEDELLTELLFPIDADGAV